MFCVFSSFLSQVQAQSTSYNSYAMQLLLQNLKSNQLAEAAFVLLRMAKNLSDSQVVLPVRVVCCCSVDEADSVV